VVNEVGRPGEPRVLAKDLGVGIVIFAPSVGLPDAARQPDRRAERLHDHIFVQRFRRQPGPIGVFEQQVAIEPRDLGARFGKARRRDIQQPLLLPHDAGAAQPEHAVAFRKLEFFVIESEFYDQDIGANFLHAFHERVEIRALGLVSAWIKIGRDRPQVGTHSSTSYAGITKPLNCTA
jgi:hypothetical protein